MIRLFALFLLCLTPPALAVDAGRGVDADTYAISFDLPENSPLEFRGGFVIRPPFSGFGGLSGLALRSPREAVLVSDKGNWIEMSLEIDAGRLTGVGDIRLQRILNAEGAPVEEGAVDAEDLTIDPATGDLWVSFERDHRLWRFTAPSQPPVETVRHRAWENFAENTGIEGLARDDLGRLWAIREASGDYSRPFPIFIWKDGRFAVKRLPRPSKHLVTGASFGPDGWLYVTERKFSFTSGFDIRLRRLKYADGEEPVAEETLLELLSATNIDNIEAITVWREGGETLILIASDDNMFLLQRNVMALFAVRG